MNQNLSIAQYVAQEAVKDNIQQVLKDKTPQFIASVTSLVNSNEALKNADKQSVLLACLTAASLDLPINQNLGFAYIIPYNDRKTGNSVAQFQMGYKGFIQLAMRSGQFRTINVNDVRDGEIKNHNRLTGEIEFEWIDGDEREKLPVIGYVAYMKLLNGFEKILYMTKKQLQAHGVKFSKSFKKGFGLWKDDFDSMAKKTVIKLLLAKYAPMTVNMQTATLSDQAIIRDDGYEYADNAPVDIDEINNSKENDRVLKHIENAKDFVELAEVEGLINETTQPAFEAKLKKLNQEAKNE